MVIPKFDALVYLESERKNMLEKRIVDFYHHLPNIRTQRILIDENITYFKDLVKYSPRELLSIPNCGRKSLNEIKEFLEKFNLKLKEDEIKIKKVKIETIGKRLGDISDLPEELKEQLKSSTVNDHILEALTDLGGIANLDEILISIYRKHHKIYKRIHISNQIYSLIKEKAIKKEKRGIYCKT